MTLTQGTTPIIGIGVALILLATTTPLAQSQQATFQEVPDIPRVNAVSGDGSTVVGEGPNGNSGAFWTVGAIDGTPLIFQGTFSNPLFRAVKDVSADGKKIIGILGESDNTSLTHCQNTTNPPPFTFKRVFSQVWDIQTNGTNIRINLPRYSFRMSGDPAIEKISAAPFGISRDGTKIVGPAVQITKSSDCHNPFPLPGTPVQVTFKWAFQGTWSFSDLRNVFGTFLSRQKGLLKFLFPLSDDGQRLKGVITALI